MHRPRRRARRPDRVAVPVAVPVHGKSATTRLGIINHLLENIERRKRFLSLILILARKPSSFRILVLVFILFLFVGYRCDRRLKSSMA